MACRNEKAELSLFRGLSTQLTAPGILAFFVICCICCNNHVCFANASHEIDNALSGDSAAENLSPYTVSSAAEEEGLTTVTPATAHNGETSLSTEADKDERVPDADDACGWRLWKPFSTAINWVKKSFGPSKDQKAVSEGGNASVNPRTSEGSIFRKLFSLGKLTSLLSGPSATEKPKKDLGPIVYHPNQCSSALCREIALQMQRDMNYGAEPCTNVNEHYCGGWMRRTKIPEREDSWIISTDPVHKGSTDFLISTLESLSCPTSATLPQAAVQDQWDSLLACSYQMCTDEDTLNMRGAKPLFAAMFDEDEANVSSLSFLVQSNFNEEAEAAQQADRLIRLKIESAEADAVIASVNSLVAAAGGSVIKAAGRYKIRPVAACAEFSSHPPVATAAGGVCLGVACADPVLLLADAAVLVRVCVSESVCLFIRAALVWLLSLGKRCVWMLLLLMLQSLLRVVPTTSAGEILTSTDNGKVTNPNSKALLRILVPRLRSIYRRMNAQFFWSLLTVPHELDATKGHMLTIADLILGLPYRYYELKNAEQQLHYKRYLARLLRTFDTHLSQYRRGIYENGMTSNPNMQLSYDERARRIFDFEAKVLRRIVLSPEALRDVEANTHSVTFDQLKNSASSLDVEAIIKIYLEDLPAVLSPTASPSPSFTSHMASLRRNMNGIAVTESGEVVIDNSAEFIVYQKDYFSKIEKVLYDIKNWAVLHDYILVNLIRNQAKLLSDDFRSATEELLSSSTGMAPVPRSRRCLRSLPKWLLSRLYVRGAFPVENKTYVIKTVGNVKSAFHDMIQQSTWMDGQTRKRALEKLAAMKEKIGYPDWLVDPIESQVYFEKYYGKGSLALKAAQTGYHDFIQYMRKQEIISALRNYGTLPDPEEWEPLPHVVGAEYVVTRNEIRLTAAFLQKPVMFMHSNNASREELLVTHAINYGGLAAFIGRELARAFDREGSEYDAHGQPNYWWSWESEVAFGKRLQCLRDQYSSYFIEVDLSSNAADTHPTNYASQSAGENAADVEQSATSAASHIPVYLSGRHTQIQTIAAGVAWEAATKANRTLRKVEKRNQSSVALFVDGASLMGMNYRDNAGLQAAWSAIQKELTAAELDEKPLRSLGAFLTVKQIFLFGWGHFWCEVSKPDFLRKQIVTSSSTPSRFRSEGALANFGLFAAEYKCSEDTPLKPAGRCTVW